MSRRRTSPAPPLDDEDLLEEILLRLPPQPSSFARASLICKRWQSIVYNLQFLRRFRKLHRNPPLLSFFTGPVGTAHNLPAIFDPPVCIPSMGYTRAQMQSSNNYQQQYFMGSQHRYLVLINRLAREIVVRDPLTGQQHRVPFPSRLNNERLYTSWFWHVVVTCADTEDVHGDCFSSPFKLAFVWVVQGKQAFGCLYESVSGVWGGTVSMASTDTLYYTGPSVLVRNAIYWLLGNGDILSFDFESLSFDVIERPADSFCHFDVITSYRSVQLLRTEDCGLGLAILSGLTIRLWERKSNYDGVSRWLLLQKTIQLDLFPCTMHTDFKTVLIMGYDEESNIIILSTIIGKFMLQLDSMQIRRIVKTDTICHNNFYL